MTNVTNKNNTIESCDCNVIHGNVVKHARNKMPEEEIFNELADLFKVFGDPTRVRILWALDEAEMCVCDIAVLLNMTQSAISHQLRVLKQFKLVKNKREGKIVFYSINDEYNKDIFNQVLSHINDN